MNQKNKSLYTYLYHVFNHDNFQEGQKEIITDILNGNDVLGILRTGSGKSLCYQLPAIMLPGATVVVSPLISLMIDQVRQVKSYYYKEVVAIHSFQNMHERRKILSRLHFYKLIYVSPELLQQQEFLQKLKEIKVSLFVIDEAHCISQWGYDFRPDYLRLTNVINILGNPPILALTGTATPEVQKDIMENLELQYMKRHIYPMDRENISLLLHHVNGSEEDKLNILSSLVSTYQQPTIVYFSSRNLTEKIASVLSQRVPDRKIAYYHGGMENNDRLKIQQQFMNEQLDVICCTSAFGMGINKKNIRLVIHYHLPTQIESYIQEIGRAGRDGKESISILLYKEGDIHVPLQIIENELPNEKEVSFVMNQLYILHQKGKSKIPTSDEQLEQIFQLPITKWRFLHYQFESHGMIKENMIIYDKKYWQEIFQKINRFCTMRKNLKYERLDDLINWVNTKECLRKKLYQNFQQQIPIKETQCCSNCGFSYEKWEKEIRPIKREKLEQQSWQHQLADLLLIGD